MDTEAETFVKGINENVRLRLEAEKREREEIEKILGELDNELIRLKGEPQGVLISSSLYERIDLYLTNGLGSESDVARDCFGVSMYRTADLTSGYKVF